jgi:nitrous oxidase accessory protein NosD
VRSVAGGAAEGAGNIVVGPVGVLMTKGATSNLVIGNTLRPKAFFEEDEAVGILVVAATTNLIAGNRVDSGRVGIRLDQDADGNMVRGNLLAGLSLGMDVRSSGNLIVVNRFRDNRRQAVDRGSANRWDDGTVGNHWSDRPTPDANGDGIVDTGRKVPPNGLDQFPLAEPP